MIDLSLTVAFLGGLVSFLSPCVFPLVPGYLAYLAGTSVGGAEMPSRWRTFISSVFFVLGFSFVFALLGVLLNTLLEAVAYDVQLWLSRIGGVIIIFFGLYLTGLIRIAYLEREHKLHLTKRFGSTYVTSFVFGAAFAAGWTPCVGAALGAILGLAANAPGQAFILLMSYALGLALPFLVVGAFAARAQGFMNHVAPYLKYVNILFGFILIALGVLVFTQQLNLIANLGFLNDLLLK